MLFLIMMKLCFLVMCNIWKVLVVDSEVEVGLCSIELIMYSLGLWILVSLCSWVMFGLLVRCGMLMILVFSVVKELNIRNQVGLFMKIMLFGCRKWCVMVLMVCVMFVVSMNWLGVVVIFSLVSFSCNCWCSGRKFSGVLQFSSSEGLLWLMVCRVLVISLLLS